MLLQLEAEVGLASAELLAVELSDDPLSSLALRMTDDSRRSGWLEVVIAGPAAISISLRLLLMIVRSLKVGVIIHEDEDGMLIVDRSEHTPRGTILKKSKDGEWTIEDLSAGEFSKALSRLAQAWGSSGD